MLPEAESHDAQFSCNLSLFCGGTEPSEPEPEGSRKPHKELRKSVVERHLAAMREEGLQAQTDDSSDGEQAPSMARHQDLRKSIVERHLDTMLEEGHAQTGDGSGGPAAAETAR